MIALPRFSDEFLQELRARCDIEQIISGYVQLRRRGKNLVGLCPFHNEKTPSFTVYPENQSYYCFGCGAGGEVINFIRRIENLDYVEAVRFLCDRAGIMMPLDGADDSMALKRRRIYEMNREAARFFHDTLLSPAGEAGLNYYKSRGYSKRTITKFGLGYAPNSWNALRDHLREKGYSYEEQLEANLLQRSVKSDRTSYYDNFRGRVIVPIIDVRGNVVAFGGRVLDDSKPKYINTADTPVYKKSLGVFGLNFAKNSKEKTLILVEGYMDAISLHQAGFDNAIACLGTALTGEMARLLMRYADEVLLCYDADEAGQKATQKAIAIFSSIGAKQRVIRLSGGKDPDEILRKYGPERFRSLIEGASNEIEFKLLRARDGLDLHTDDGRLKYLNLAAEVLADVNNAIAVDIYVSRLSEKLEVDKQAILSRLELIRKRKRSQSRKAAFQTVQKSFSADAGRAAAAGSSLRGRKAQKRVLTLLCGNPDFLPELRSRQAETLFDDPLCRRIYEVLAARIESGGSLDFTALSGELSREEMDLLVGECQKDKALPGSRQELHDCIETLQSEKKKQQSKNTQASALEGDDFRALFRPNDKK